MLNRSLFSLSATLGIVLMVEGVLVTPLRAQSTSLPPTSPTLWNLPARCAAISRSSLPQNVPYTDVPFRELGKAILQFSLAAQYSAALAFIQSLSAEERQMVLPEFSSLYQEVMRSGTAADRAAVHQYALQLFEGITEKDLAGQWVLFQRLIEISLQEQQVDQAVALSRQVVKLSSQFSPDRSQRQELLGSLIEPYFKSGLETATLQVIDASDDPIFQTLVRQELAEQAIQQGRVAQAEALLRQALSLLPPSAKSEYRVGLLTDLALLPDIQPEQAKSWITEALSLLQTLPDNPYKASLLIKLAHQQQRLGQPQAADQSLRQTQAIAQKLVQALTQKLVKNPNEFNFLPDLARTALAQKQGETADQLLNLALQLKAEANSTKASFARYYAEAGLIDRAIQISNLITNDFSREAVQVEIAISALKLGRTEQALTLANRLKESLHQQRFTEQSIIQFLKTGQEKAALKLTQQPGNFDILLRLIMWQEQEGQTQNIDWLLKQATRLANTFPASQKQQALLRVAVRAMELYRFDQVLSLQASLEPSAIKDLNRNILRVLEKGVTPDREAQAFQFLMALPDSPLKLQAWLTVMAEYAGRGRKLPVFPAAKQAAQWVKGDREKQMHLIDAYRNLRAFEPALELWAAINPNPDFWELRLLRLELWLETGNRTAAQQELVILRQEAEQYRRKPQISPQDRLISQIEMHIFLAPYYAAVGDRAEAITQLAQAVKLQQEPTFRKESRDAQNRLVAAAVNAYAKVAHAAIVAGERELAQQAIAQGQSLLQQLQPYRPDITAAKTLACVQATYALK